MAAGLCALAASFNQSGQGSEQTYVNWVVWPLVVAGAVMVAIAVGCAIFLALPVIEIGPRPFVATALAVGLVAGCSGAVVAYRRDHPEASEVAALRHLVPPRGATEDRTSFGSQVGDTPPPIVAGPPGDGPPTAVRSWHVPAGVNACAQTEAVAKAWLGSMTELEPCVWDARYQGWYVSVYVTDNISGFGQYAVFEVGAPGGIG